MNCADFKKQYEAMLDGPSDASVSEAVERHLEACPSCAGYAEALLAELKGLAPLLPKWRVTDEAWSRLTAGAASSRAVRFGFLWTFARAAAVAAILLAAALFTYRTLSPAWETAAAEKTLDISPKTKILLSAGTQYRLEHDEKKAGLVLKMNRGEAVLGIERGVFREAAVELPAARVTVTGTFFMVKTVGAFDFIVEVLEGSVRIEAEGRALRLESGKSADKRKERLVVCPLSPERENELRAASFRLFGAPEAARQEAPARATARRAPVKPRAPAMPLPSLNPESGKDYYEKLRAYQPAADTGRFERDAGKSVEPEEEEPPEKAWSMPEGKPYLVKQGVEIWHADTKEPVRWYEELGEFEFKNGGTGAQLEAMAVRRASRMGADGFIVLSAGKMDGLMSSEIEFRRGKAQDLTVNQMDLKQYGDIYDSENFSTRSRMKQEAFYLRAKFFKYY